MPASSAQGDATETHEKQRAAAAATKIQAIYRGQAARKQLPTTKPTAKETSVGVAAAQAAATGEIVESPHAGQATPDREQETTATTRTDDATETHEKQRAAAATKIQALVRKKKQKEVSTNTALAQPASDLTSSTSTKTIEESPATTPSSATQGRQPDITRTTAPEAEAATPASTSVKSTAPNRKSAVGEDGGKLKDTREAFIKNWESEVDKLASKIESFSTSADKAATLRQLKTETIDLKKRISKSIKHRTQIVTTALQAYLRAYMQKLDNALNDAKAQEMTTSPAADSPA